MPERSARDDAVSLCVYCGAKPGGDPRFRAEAESLGAGAARRGWRLVYGAGDLGLMGAASGACLAADGQAMGFIPKGLWEREIAARAWPQVVVTESLHQRKALMLQNAHAVAVLPGGLGTLDELVECVTWAQLGLHAKPIVIVDVARYWAPLQALFAQMAENGFLHGPLAPVLDWADTAEQALDRVAERLAERLAERSPPPVDAP